MERQVRNKLQGGFRKTPLLWIYLLIGFVAVMIVGSMGYIFYTGSSMAAGHGPLVDAAMEVKLEATMAHLWFEEIISGDRAERIDDALGHLDQAAWYAQAMLEGGENAEGTFVPLSDPDLRRKIAAVRRKLAEFRDLTLQRWDAGASAGIGTEIDQKYDAAFEDFVGQADQVETSLQKLIQRELSSFRIVQMMLIVICLFVTVVVGVIFGRFVRRQIRDEIKLQAANQQLDASNQQLAASEQQLRASEIGLRESEEKFRLLYEQAPLGYQSLDADGRFMTVNQAWLDLLGYPEDEVINRWFGDFLIPEQRERFQASFHRFKAAGEVFGVEFELVKKGGGHVLLSFDGRISRNPQGQFQQTHCIMHDITKRKKAEKELFDNRSQLKSLASELVLAEERERNRIAANLHDDVCQNLAYTKMKVQVVKAALDDQAQIEDMTEVINTLTRTMQDVRYLTFELSSPVLKELGLEAAVSHWLAEQIEQKHGIATEFTDDGQTKPLEKDVQALLFRSVRELLANVVKHSQAKRVKVAVSRAKDQVLIHLEDDGVGFSPDKVVVGKGTGGFGLFSIRERLSQMGGSLEIDSSPGTGCRSLLRAPLRH